MDVEEKRQILFPEITDWYGDHNERRFATNFRKMSIKEFFWFTPAAFKLVYYGTDIIHIIIFGTLALLLAILFSPIISLGAIIFFLIFIISLTKKLLKRASMKTTNMYDLHLRKK